VIFLQALIFLAVHHLQSQLPRPPPKHPLIPNKLLQQAPLQANQEQHHQPHHPQLIQENQKLQLDRFSGDYSKDKKLSHPIIHNRNFILNNLSIFSRDL